MLEPTGLIVRGMAPPPHQPNGLARMQKPDPSVTAGPGRSGKSARDENFPVASRLISARLRPHVMAFYDFARTADDVADDPVLGPAEKLAELDALEAALGGAGPEVGQRLARSLASCGVGDHHARALLNAFRMDATKSRYADWHELLDYCALSADPVGRFLLDLHCEDRALRPSSDALCTVLQILNHIQDCKNDFRTLDRVYVPFDLLRDEGLGVDALSGPVTTPALRRALDTMLDRCESLLSRARSRPVPLRSRRLAAEMGVITRLAARLIVRLRREDPLAGRVALGRADFARAGVGALPSLLRRGRA